MAADQGSTSAVWSVERGGQLKKSGQVMLDATGNGVLYFSPDHANQRWEVTSIVVFTNQPANASIVPVATCGLNSTDVTTMSQGNQRGSSWSGNQDTFQGLIDIGPCDFLGVIFAPPPGSTAGQIAQLAGVVAAATVLGSKFSKRG